MTYLKNLLLTELDIYCIKKYMNFIFKSEIIDYDYFINSNNKNVIFLHGWGGNKFSFNKTINLLKNRFSILAITMPTINNTNLSWTMFDYCNLVIQICELYNIKNCYVVCHSFGLRVATLLKDFINIERIVITGGAGMKKLNFIKKIEQNNAKLLLKCNKFKFLYKKAASKDYLNLSNTNKITFKNIVNLATNSISKFNCPMFLFWGKFDNETGIWIAKKLKKINTNCELEIKNGGHFAYLDFNAEFNNRVVRFLCG